MNLEKIQTKLHKIITAPVGVHKMLSWRQQKELPLLGDKRLSAAERLDIYANMYFFRILDSLKTDFPRVYKILGDVRFHNLITDYLVKYPPTHFSLRNAGLNLPLFLKTHGESKKNKFLPDLALFEWNMIEVFDAADTDLVTRDTLSQINPKAWAGMTLEFIPALRLMNSGFGVNSKTPEKKSKGAILIWRKNFKVYHRALDRFEEKLFRVMRAGKTFADACAKVVQIESGEKDMQKIGACLLRWFDDKLINHLHT